MTDIPELTAAQVERAMPASVRRRLMAGQIESGADIVALRKFLGLTQERFASAVGISVHTLRNWEQGRRRPEGAARRSRASSFRARGILVPLVPTERRRGCTTRARTRVSGTDTILIALVRGISVC